MAFYNYGDYQGGANLPGTSTITFSGGGYTNAESFPGIKDTVQSAGQMTYAAGDTRTLYGTPTPIAQWAGSYTAAIGTFGGGMGIVTSLPLTINADGSFTTAVGSCNIAGTTAQHKATGLFDVSATVSGASCNMNGALVGIMTPTGFSTSAKSFVIQLRSTDATRSALIYVR
jgi:hypothetical protein